ncbi:MAG: hypothetical protein B6U76_08470 [Desulfurococcales archaeon ex4484_217_2]|nr:MAG: hypothetical protein B6U76_08470 [Desulfurococcales archaeon ex4484_217_2]
MVKIDPACIPCIITVRTRELRELPIREQKKFHILRHILKYLASYANTEANITRLATQTFRILKELSGYRDPYANEKEKANKVALSFAEKIKKEITPYEVKEKLCFLIKLAVLGNALDFGVAGYKYDIDKILAEIDTMNIHIDDTGILIQMIMKSRKIVYLLDNAGEAVFDKLLVDELVDLGKRVVVVAKSGSFQNDITYDEALRLGFHRKAILVETGSDSSSIFPEETRSKVLNEILSADVVIAKGMAHYEHLTTERIIRKPVAYLLKAKCEVIARDLSVPVGSYIVKVENKIGSC